MSTKTKIVYTLGTSNREEEEFIELLKFYNIKAIIDVRRFPTSKWEHFKKEKLKVLLKKESIHYFYLGRELGGYRKEGYESYTQTVSFKKGIEKLEKIATRINSALMCAEKLPWRCHRRFIGKALQEKGWKVTHVIEKQKIWES